MSMMLRDSMRDAVSLREMMDRLLEESFLPGPRMGVRREGTARLPLDVYSTPEEIVVTAAVPGLKPDDVEITLEGDALMIKGEFPAPMENVNYEMRERFFGPFARTLTFNVPIDGANIEATFENGLLTLVIPKAQAVRPKSIKITTKE